QGREGRRLPAHRPQAEGPRRPRRRVDRERRRLPQRQPPETARRLLVGRHRLPLRQGHGRREGGTMRALPVLLLLAASALAADGPQLLGPNRNGTTAEKGLIDTFGKKGPEVLWQRKVGEGFATPVIADGKLVLFHRVGNEDVVECLSADKGKELWKF